MIQTTNQNSLQAQLDIKAGLLYYSVMQKKIIPTEELKHALSHIATIKISEIGLSEADELDYLLEPYYKDMSFFQKSVHCVMKLSTETMILK